MAECDIPRGQRFSHVYLQRPDQLEDSEKMRRRLGAAMCRLARNDSWIQAIFDKLGILPVYLLSSADWMNFFLKLDLIDALDSITIIFRCAKIEYNTAQYYDRENALLVKDSIIASVRRIFLEERVRYKIDNDGGVHLAVDQQFELAKAATVQGMGDPRYAEALRRLEDGYRALDGVPPDGRAAVRGVFDAAENLFKQTFGADRLVAHLIEEELKPAVGALGWNAEAQAAGEAMIDALKDWVKARHKYRHQAGHPDPHQPPLDLAILMVTQGTGLVRWLVTIDKAVTAAVGHRHGPQGGLLVDPASPAGGQHFRPRRVVVAALANHSRRPQDRVILRLPHHLRQPSGVRHDAVEKHLLVLDGRKLLCVANEHDTGWKPCEEVQHLLVQH